jgi:Rieske Fe-S protein
MDRRNFLIKSCAGCASFVTASAVLISCSSTKYISGKLVNDGLMLNKDDFKIKHRGGTAYSSFVIVRNEALKYPICVYRLNDQEYTAIWMRCTHQGTELQASGDVLQCSAHGSEFNNKGEVRNGPASSDLRVFPVTVRSNEIFIDLRKQS